MSQPDTDTRLDAEADGALVPVIDLAVVRARLEEIDTPEQAQEIADRGAALLVVARRRKATLEARNDLAEIQIRAERRIGQLLPPPGVGSANAVGSANTDDQLDGVFGLTRPQRSEFRLLAELPDDVFEELVSSTKASKKGLSTRRLVRAARRWRRGALSVAAPPPPPALPAHDARDESWAPVEAYYRDLKPENRTRYQHALVVAADFERQAVQLSKGGDADTEEAFEQLVELTYAASHAVSVARQLIVFAEGGAQ